MNTLGNATRDRAAACHHEGDQVLVVNLLLAIRQFGESRVEMRNFIAAQVVTEFAILEGERVTPGMLAKNETIGGYADGFRSHDLVTERIAQYPVLVNAGFMREGVAPDNGLIGLHLETDDFTKQLARRVELLAVYSTRNWEKIVSNVKCHNDFFE